MADELYSTHVTMSLPEPHRSSSPVTSKPGSREPSSESSPTTQLISNDSHSSTFISPLIWILRLFFPSPTFAKFFAHGIIPPLANNLIPLFFIGNIPTESALAIAGQFTFISVILEVIQEGIVNSLFHYVGRTYTIDRLRSLQCLKICLTILLLLGTLLTIAMVLLNKQFVTLIDTPDAIVDSTRTYLYISAFSFPIVLIDAALSNYLLITTSSYLIVAQLSSVLISFFTNFFLFGQQSFSLQWSVNELGYYKLIQAGLGCLNNLLFCVAIEKLEFFKGPIFRRNFKENCSELLKISWGNFGDSGIRNFFYFVVTLKFINALGETEVAAWNLLNSIVWGLLLIPSFTVANYIKVKIGHSGTKQKISSVFRKSFRCLIAWIFIVATATALLWPRLAAFFGKSNRDAQELSTKMIVHVGPIFIVFSFNNAMDSMFYGIGKTEYVFYQSLLTNLTVYLIPWILYLIKIIKPSYILVVSLYIGGMLVDFGLTLFFSYRVWTKMSE